VPWHRYLSVPGKDVLAERLPAHLCFVILLFRELHADLRLPADDSLCGPGCVTSTRRKKVSFSQSMATMTSVDLTTA